MNRRQLIMRRFIFAFVITALLPLASHAEEQQIGRLFMSPKERAELDRVRRGGVPLIKEKEKGTEEEASSTVRPPDANLTIDGYVQRNGSGKSTVWINSQAQYGNERMNGPTLLSNNGKPGAVALQLPSGRNVHLKAGQSIDIATGQVREGYETGLLVSDIPSASARRGKR